MTEEATQEPLRPGVMNDREPVACRDLVRNREAISKPRAEICDRVDVGGRVKRPDQVTGISRNGGKYIICGS